MARLVRVHRLPLFLFRFDQTYCVQGDEVPIKLGFKDVIFVMEDVDAASKVRVWLLVRRPWFLFRHPWLLFAS